MPKTTKRTRTAPVDEPPQEVFDPASLTADTAPEDEHAYEEEAPAPPETVAADVPELEAGGFPAIEIRFTIPAPVQFQGLAVRSVPSAKLTRLQALGQKYLRQALSDEKVRVPGGPGRHPEGRVADDLQDAVRYVYQQIGEQVLAQLGVSVEQAASEYGLTI